MNSFLVKNYFSSQIDNSSFLGPNYPVPQAIHITETTTPVDLLVLKELKGIKVIL